MATITARPRLFWNSQTNAEKAHIVKALRFELSHVQKEFIRVRILVQLSQLAEELAARVAEGLAPWFIAAIGQHRF